MKYISFTLRVTIVIFALSPPFPSLTQAKDYLTKCETKYKCKILCKDQFGTCYKGGVCKCYDANGDGVPPLLKGKDNGGKCTEVKEGEGSCKNGRLEDCYMEKECKRSCDQSETNVVNNPYAYTCADSKFCFCKFEVKPDVLTKCDNKDTTNAVCQPRSMHPNHQLCPDNAVTCDKVGTCSCSNGDILNTKSCKEEEYCHGVCRSALEKKGKLCSVANNKKACVCYGTAPKEN